MSWFARTIANSLRLDDDEDEYNGGDLKSPPTKHDSEPDSASTPSPTARGVKEDFSELTKSLSRQLWGVASFLAPPPDPQPENPLADPNPNPDDDDDDEDVIAGIRNDFAEISGKFKSGISKISGNKTVSEFTKIASSFLQLGSQEVYDLDGVVGVTEDVVAFARSVALHPETWLDFPLHDDNDSDDFDLSDAQQEHALAVEHLAPSLAALRMELCPGYMSDGNFWKIYFVLVHPRLSKSDADILSTTQIVEARAMLTQALDKRGKEMKGSELSVEENIPLKEEEQHLFVPSNAQPESAPLQTSAVEAAPSKVVADVEKEKYATQSAGTQIIDNSVVKETPLNPQTEQSPSGSTNRFLDDTYEDDADDWLKEEDTSEMVGPSRTSIHTGNDEDVSFSDLEEEDGDIHASYKKTSGSDSSTKDSRDWVQLGRNSPNSDKDINSLEGKRAGSEHSSARNSVTKDSNDWLNVDDIDVM
ncbi:hypothetical protein VNO78_08055 [Psophocarpus tetragonolobus]|uniref:BSD domain-containing protein n=1 Tax=Psophocarpus tetragonolobus TaxID=3891 RepID=A0AAN9XTC4_PSOTE